MPLESNDFYRASDELGLGGTGQHGCLPPRVAAGSGRGGPGALGAFSPRSRPTGSVSWAIYVRARAT
eukprot:10570648-Lingulodinium_polyedra.AAC.1